MTLTLVLDPVENGVMAYRVQLNSYHGPLDLLLFLVKKEEVDILDIPIARLTEQFLVYLYTLQQLDVELAGEFLVIAATLMEIKCKSLIEEELETEYDEIDLPDDPRKDLVKQLLEYRRFRDAMVALEQCAERAAMSFSRVAPASPNHPDAVEVKTVELWDLVSAFARILRETQTAPTDSIVRDETPQHIHEASILERVRVGLISEFKDVFDAPKHRSRLIGLFLALLELVKRGDVRVSQEHAFGDIRLSLPTLAS